MNFAPVNAYHKTNYLTITTPEGIEFSLQLAGPVPRFLAWSIDLLVILAANQLLNVMLGIIGIASIQLENSATRLMFGILSINETSFFKAKGSSSIAMQRIIKEVLM